MLDLSYNPMAEIPIESGNLELLKQLNEYDVGMGLLKQLEILDVSHCNISVWPPQLEQLENLKHLNISHNFLATVPAGVMGPLKRLVHFDCSYNQISSLPSDLYELKALQVIFNVNWFARCDIF